jgi:hypothetical protein
MEDDLISCLTRQVKEEVIENYLTERRIVDLQMEEIHERAQKLHDRAEETGRRLNRLSYLVISPEMRERLISLLQIPKSSFWNECMEKKFTRKVRFIRVKSLTEKGRFRKLFSESYHRLRDLMESYRCAYEDLRIETRVVNSNISKFQRNFDLLSIISFLKSLDTCTLERKRFLGENFTPEELASVDRKLYLHPIAFESLDLPAPLSLPTYEVMEEPIGEFALEIYRKHQSSVKRLLR